MPINVGESLRIAALAGVEPGADGRKLRAGGGGVGIKGVGAAPLHDAQTRHGGDGGICPIVIRNIGIGIAGQKIAVTHLIFQKPEENGGGLRTGDQSIWVNIAIIVTDDIGKVVFAVQQLRCGAAVVPNRRAVQGVAVLRVHLFNGEIEVGGGGAAAGILVPLGIQGDIPCDRTRKVIFGLAGRISILKNGTQCNGYYIKFSRDG